MQLIETTNNSGLVEYVERETRRPYSSSGNELRDIIIGLNTAEDMLLPDLLIMADGMAWDDPRHSKQPSATFNLSATSNEYKFAEDSESMDIVNITHVGVKDDSSDTAFRFLERIKSNDPRAPHFISPDTAVTGKPSQFLELGGRIYFDVIADTAITSGGKILFGREQKRFTVTGTRANDSTEPGIATPFHTLIADMEALRWYETNKSTDPRINVLRDRIESKRSDLRAFVRAQHPAKLQMTFNKRKHR